MATRIEPAKEPFSEAVQGWLGRTMAPGRAPLLLFTTLARDERLFNKFFSGVCSTGATCSCASVNW